MATRRTHDYYDDVWSEYRQRSPLPRYVFWSVLVHVMTVAAFWLAYTYAPEPEPIQMFNVSLVDADRIGDQAATAPEPTPEPPKEEVEPTPPPPPPPPPPKPEPPKPEPKEPEPPKEEPKPEPKPEPAVKKEEPKPEPPKEEPKPEPKKPDPPKEEPKKPEPPKEEPKPKEPERDPFEDLLAEEPPMEKLPPRQAVARAPVSQPGLNIDTNALPSELSYWGGSVKRKIERMWRAPEGIPLDPDNRYSVIAFVVSRDGRLLGEPRIVKIGPDPRLAQSAISAVKTAQPFPPLPDGWRGSEQEVIISFGVD